MAMEHSDLPQGLSLSAIFLPLSNMVDVFLIREKRTIAFDDSEISRKTCGYLIADRRHIVHSPCA
jgi:hypothetical protein